MAFREIPSEILNPWVKWVASSTNYFDFTCGTHQPGLHPGPTWTGTDEGQLRVKGKIRIKSNG
jgi:hypothetical protein